MEIGLSRDYICRSALQGLGKAPPNFVLTANFF